MVSFDSNKHFLCIGSAYATECRVRPFRVIGRCLTEISASALLAFCPRCRVSQGSLCNRILVPPPGRLKQHMCCSISAGTRKPPPNLSLRPQWEEPRKQPMTTWTQTEQPSRQGTGTETYMANRDPRTHTSCYFSDRRLHRLNIINPPLIFYLISVSIVVNGLVRRETCSPAADGQLVSDHSLLVWS